MIVTKMTFHFEGSGTTTSKLLSSHSAISPSLLTYISVPTSRDGHNLLTGGVPGSCTKIISLGLITDRLGFDNGHK